MADNILLNNNIYHISEGNLPCLITYGEKVGGSHFSITMTADLFLRGSKILFLTAYPMAKDNFLKQIKEYKEKVSYITKENQLDNKFQTIIIESGNEDLFLKAIKKLDDAQERIILIKNMEVFSDEVFNVCLNFKKVILSGDIDKCSFKERINEKEFKTIIAFSKPKIKLPIVIPELEKYIGYFKNNNEEGLVSIKKSVVINEAGIDDLEYIQDIFSDWLSQEETNYYLKSVREIISDPLSNSKFDSHYYVSRFNDKVVGVAGYRSLNPKLSKFATANNPAELCMVYVSKEHVGTKGIGRALVEYVIKKTKDSNYTELIIRSADKFQNTGWGFYDHLGFNRIGSLLPPESESISQIWTMKY